MTMTNEEIIRDYREAKSPMKQIGILADMNCCTRKEIVAILAEAGEEIPKQYQKRPKAEKSRGGGGTLETESPAFPGGQHEEVLGMNDDTVPASEVLPLMVCLSAIESIREALVRSDEITHDDLFACMTFREQVRGILAVVKDVERRCGHGEV